MKSSLLVICALALVGAQFAAVSAASVDASVHVKQQARHGSVEDLDSEELAGLQQLRADLITDQHDRTAYEHAVKEDGDYASVSAVDHAQYDNALGLLANKDIDVDTKLPLQGEQVMEIKEEEKKVKQSETEAEKIATEEAIVKVVTAIEEKKDEEGSACGCCPCHCCSHPEKSCAGYICKKKGWRPLPNALAILLPEGQDVSDDVCCEEIPQTCGTVAYKCPNGRQLYPDVPLNGRNPSDSLCCEPEKIVTDKTCAEFLCPETHERVPNADKVKVVKPTLEKCCVEKLTCKTAKYKCQGPNMIPRGDYDSRYINSDQAASDDLCCEKEQLTYTCDSVECGSDMDPKTEDEAGGPFKDPPTKDQCCKAKPFTCEPIKCPSTHKVNTAAAGKEFPKQPQVAECCLPKKTCKGYTCKGKNMKPRPEPQTIYVLDEPTDGDCCVEEEPVYTCSTVKCEPDMIPKETDVTSKTPLTKEQCCEKPKFTCKTVRCPRDMKPIESKADEEFDEEPEESDCCEKKPTCALPLYECKQEGFVLKGSASSIFLDKEADDATCCEEKEKEYTCKEVECGADWDEKPGVKTKIFKTPPSRVDCCVEKEYTCDDFGKCPTNWTPKSSSKTKEVFKRRPTQADCCEEKETCGKYQCKGKNMELRSTPETIYVDGEPSDSDCCVEKKPKYTCKDIECNKGYEKRNTVSDTKPLFMDPPSHADCCQRKTYTCKGFKCEDNQKAKSVTKIFFEPPKLYDCCEDLPSCVKWNCVDPGKMLKPFADTLFPEKLSDDACCKDKPTYTCTGFNCAPQMADKKNAPTKLLAPPTKDDCCVPHTCEDYTCTRDNWVIKEDPGAIVLQGSPSDDDCCRETYTCQMLDCPASKRPKPLAIKKGDVAVYFTMPTVDDCCEDRPTCLEYKCQSDDMMLKDQPELIYTDRPTDAKCCKAKPTFTCEGYNCPAPMYPRDPVPKGLKVKPNDDACCLPYTCDEYKCKSEKYKPRTKTSGTKGGHQQSEDDDTKLTGPPSDEQCCDPKETCADYECPSNKIIIENASDKYLPGAPSESQCCKLVPKLKMDVIIAMDYSYSAWKNPNDLQLEIDYMNEVADALLDPDDTAHDNRVGLLGFSGSVHWHSKLTKDRKKLKGPGNKDPRTQVIDYRRCAYKSPVTGRSVWPTFTDKAIAAAQEELSASGRADAAKMLFLMTDGSPWPQVVYTSGTYQGEGGKHVSKAIQAGMEFKKQGFDVVYMSLHAADYDMYEYLSRPQTLTPKSKETEVSMFSYVDPGDSNTLLAMCIYSAKYCDICLSEYGCQGAFVNDNTLNTRTVQKWTKDKDTKPWPKDPKDSLITQRWRTAAKPNKWTMQYKWATPSQGMTRLQYTDLCWHRMADKLTTLKNGPDYADYKNHVVHIKEGWAGLKDRLPHYTEQVLADFDQTAEAVLRRQGENDSD